MSEGRNGEADLRWAREECRRLAQTQQDAPNLATARAVMDDFLDRWPTVESVRSSTAVIEGAACHRYVGDGQDPRGRLLYVHGGGFIFGSASRYGASVGRLAAEARVEAWVCDYRLSPEHRFPAALEDIDRTLDHLLGAEHTLPVVVAGDSAGGGLAVAAVMRRARRGLSLPRAVALFSPLLDLTASAKSYEDRAATDVVLSAGTVGLIARSYAPDDVNNPEVSPLLSRSFTGFPPTALYASKDEVLHDDSVTFAARLTEDGVPVRLQLEPGAPHVWTVFGDALPQARATLADAASFLQSYLA
jgi:acetyl esterase/lipase